MQTLLRVPDVIAAVGPIIGHAVLPSDIFRLIASAEIKPFGYVLRAPVFTPDQVADVAASLGEKTRKEKPCTA